MDEVPESLGRWSGFLLSWVAATADEHYTRALAEIGLTPQQLGVLTLLREGPAKQARLSERIGVFKPVMVPLVNDLAARGLAERRPHPTDRRAVEVHLLPAGEERVREAEAVSGRVSDEVFAALTPAERETFHALLVKLARART
ncbi:MarR family winged helix-turn-helix transcriptional regulator [Pseudonocardia pini]|uniref:MarR family winged helix-turn-helix transcriptional regulator n=1 Tax=Pseudonocardia pini TaxID=2758030 RepID=UPI0015F0548A|nr:MarR family transcriptional regulator [Pseudonocardia pini]